MPCPDPSALDSLARGRLSPKAAAELGEHIRTCGVCSKKHGQLAVQITLRDSGSGAPQPSGDVGLLDTIRRPPSDPGTEAAAPPTADTAHPRGSTLGRYVILDRLGAGGMGIVYAAFDPDLDRKIALKILRADVLGSSAAKELRLRLLREAQAMARVSHPNVITVHDVGIVGDQVFAAMEFVDGQTLGEWSAEEPRSWRSTLELYLKAGHGLAAAHEAGLVHRDFKPDNVLVGRDGRVRVLDFGLVHALNVPRKQDTPEPEPRAGEEKGPMKRRITQPGTLLGTPAYMSPEQLLSRATDTRSDQFSYCVALYEALYGERPFAAETAGALVAEITENRVRPEPRDSEVPGRIRRILLRGLRYDPSERYRTMDALLIGLGRRRSTVRRRWLLFGAAALAATSSLGLALAIRSQAANSCAAVADKLTGVWDPGVKAQARAAFLASGTPYAGKAWEEAARAVDLYAAAWVAERRQACEAARLRGDDAASSDEALGHRMVCLGRRLDDVQALGRLFVKADPDVVERAVPAALALPSLGGCAAPVASSRPSRDAASQEQADLLRHKLADAKARLDAGKYAEGLALARESVDTARRLADHGAEAEALYLLGSLKLKTGDPKGAEAALLDAILAAEGSREDGLSARAWVELVGVVGASQARYDDGRERARHARAALERLGGDGELEASLQNNLGVISWMQGRYDEALADHQRSLALREKTFGPTHPIVAKSLSNIGIALRAQARYDEALSHYQRAQAIEERALTPEHPAVAETLNNLANVLNEQGKRDEALAYMQRALAIKEKAYGPEALTVAVTLNNIAAVLQGQRKLEEALKFQERSLAIKTRAVSADHPSMASSLTNLASIERDLGRYADAAKSDARALAIREKAYGPEHPDLAHNLVGLGQSRLGLSSPAEALPLLERALSLRERAAVDALLLAEARFEVARALTAAKKDRARALALARQAREAYAAAGDKARDELAALDAWLAANAPARAP